MPHKEHNVIPFCNNSMIQIAECDIFLYISTRKEMTGALLIKGYFDTLLRNHFSNVVYASYKISTALCTLYNELGEW
jgi:hypothetical protein